VVQRSSLVLGRAAGFKMDPEMTLAAGLWWQGSQGGTREKGSRGEGEKEVEAERG